MLTQIENVNEYNHDRYAWNQTLANHSAEIVGLQLAWTMHGIPLTNTLRRSDVNLQQWNAALNAIRNTAYLTETSRLSVPYWLDDNDHWHLTEHTDLAAHFDTLTPDLDAGVALSAASLDLSELGMPVSFTPQPRDPVYIGRLVGISDVLPDEETRLLSLRFQNGQVTALRPQLDHRVTIFPPFQRSSYREP